MEGRTFEQGHGRYLMLSRPRHGLLTVRAKRYSNPRGQKPELFHMKLDQDGRLVTHVIIDSDGALLTIQTGRTDKDAWERVRGDLLRKGIQL